LGILERMSLAEIGVGRKDAFEDLVNEAWDDLVNYLTWILASREAAEDSCQEAFLRLWERREQWHDGSARALVFRIGKNLAYDARRRTTVRRRWVRREMEEVRFGERPDEHYENSEVEARFRKALAGLTPSRREAVEQVRLRGLSHKEAADALGISRQTVANRMTLALKDLRVLLADVLPQLPGGGVSAGGPGSYGSP
jgi:RNA polymerase sigma factor (sigma-70 family)